MLMIKVLMLSILTLLLLYPYFVYFLSFANAYITEYLVSLAYACFDKLCNHCWMDHSVGHSEIVCSDPVAYFFACYFSATV